MNRLLDATRDAVRAPMKALANILNEISGGKITPNMVTLVGLVAHFGIAWLIVDERYIWAGIFLIIFGLFDALDGQLARLQNKASNAGMVLDAVTDRMKEVILYSALAYSLINSNHPNIAVWAVIALGASMLVSYTKAKGETALSDSKLTANEKNRVFQDGFLRYEVRMFILVLGLFSGYIAESVMLIAILAIYTSLSRLLQIMQKV